MSTDVHTLSGAYALNALSPEEREEFEQHLATCAVCREEVAGFREVTAALGAESWAAPPRDLRANVLAAADRTPQQPPAPRVVELAARHRRRWPLLLAAAVAVVATAVGGLAGVRSLQDDQDPELVAAAQLVFNASDSAQVAVPTSNGGTLHVAISPGRAEMAVDARDLPALDQEHVYQLWAVRDGAMSSKGVLASGTTGAAMGIPDDGTQIAVTVEPGSGSEQPTTEPIATVDPAAL